jgi:hypothetical protein
VSLTKQQKDRARKHQEWLGRTMAENSLFVSIYGLESAVQTYKHNGQKKAVTLPQARAVEKAALKWKIGCYAICKDSTGRDYIKSMSINLTEPVKQDAINKALSNAHFDWMMAECNMNHVLTLAWVATAGAEPSDDVAMSIFSKAKVFERLKPVTIEGHGVFITNPVEVVKC